MRKVKLRRYKSASEINRYRLKALKLLTAATVSFCVTYSLPELNNLLDTALSNGAKPIIAKLDREIEGKNAIIKSKDFLNDSLENQILKLEEDLVVAKKANELFAIKVNEKDAKISYLESELSKIKETISLRDKEIISLTRKSSSKDKEIQDLKKRIGLHNGNPANPNWAKSSLYSIVDMTDTFQINKYKEYITLRGCGGYYDRVASVDGVSFLLEHKHSQVWLTPRYDIFIEHLKAGKFLKVCGETITLSGFAQAWDKVKD